MAGILIVLLLFLFLCMRVKSFAALTDGTLLLPLLRAPFNVFVGSGGLEKKSRGARGEGAAKKKILRLSFSFLQCKTTNTCWQGGWGWEEDFNVIANSEDHWVTITNVNKTSSPRPRPRPWAADSSTPALPRTSD